MRPAGPVKGPIHAAAPACPAPGPAEGPLASVPLTAAGPACPPGHLYTEPASPCAPGRCWHPSRAAGPLPQRGQGSRAIAPVPEPQPERGAGGGGCRQGWVLVEAGAGRFRCWQRRVPAEGCAGGGDAGGGGCRWTGVLAEVGVGGSGAGRGGCWWIWCWWIWCWRRRVLVERVPAEVGAGGSGAGGGGCWRRRVPAERVPVDPGVRSPHTLSPLGESPRPPAPAGRPLWLPCLWLRHSLCVCVRCPLSPCETAIVLWPP